MSKPIVAVVGRPNVGKSTLFNALAGGNISIVQDTPGVTRDRIYAEVSWTGYEFTLIDTGGIEPESADVLLRQMREQAEIAIDTADVIIFLVDAKDGLVDADASVADMLRRAKKPVVLAVNKVDSFGKQQADIFEFYSLGLGDPLPISAANRQGLGELLDEVTKDFDAGLFEDVNAVAVGLNHRAVKRIACMAHFFGVIVDEHDFVALQHKHLGQLHAGEPGAYYEYSHGGFVRRIL